MLCVLWLWWISGLVLLSCVLWIGLFALWVYSVLLRFVAGYCVCCFGSFVGWFSDVEFLFAVLLF